MKKLGLLLAALCVVALPSSLWGKKSSSNSRSTVVRPKPVKRKPPHHTVIRRDSKGRIVQITSTNKPNKNRPCAANGGGSGPCPGMPVEPAMPKPYKGAGKHHGKTQHVLARPVTPPAQAAEPSQPAAAGAGAAPPAP